ncbi:MAG: hypothetical protein MZW92_48335 [Comamonadaceae bacterium]|nr:hypothetical protein [Comamonadaceae bacterium]
MPRHGFTRMFERMLDHPNIEVHAEHRLPRTSTARDRRTASSSSPARSTSSSTIASARCPTAACDFEHEHLHAASSFQPVGTVNYPNDHAYTRITEFKHLTGQAHRKTCDRLRVPARGGRAVLPDPAPGKRRHCTSATRRWPKPSPASIFVGRLASTRYYNMDQVVAQALSTFKRLEAGEGARRHHDAAPPPHADDDTSVAGEEDPGAAIDEGIGGPVVPETCRWARHRPNGPTTRPPRPCGRMSPRPVG